MSSGSCRFSPVELFIGGTKVVIVDPHNDIVPYWFQEFLRQKCSLIVVHIDAHHDMFHCCPALPAREGREKFQFIARLMPYLQDYCRKKVNEGNFTCPAFHTGVVGALYHFHPQENQIDEYPDRRQSTRQRPPKKALIPTKKRANGLSGMRTQPGSKAAAPRALPCPGRLTCMIFNGICKIAFFPLR